MFLKEYLNLTEEMKDPVSEEILAVYNDYLSCMRSYFQKACKEKGDPNSDELYIPICPVEDAKALREDFFPQLFHGRFIWSGAVEEKDDILKIYRYMVRHGIAKGGLYGHMPYRNGNQHIWYLSFPDYYWFKIWKNLGNQEKAREILDFQLRYGMTEEYYMVERYTDNDPYYVPWSPNAGANGRTILMLLEI